MNKYTWDDYERLKANEIKLQNELEDLNKEVLLKSQELEIAKGKLNACKKELEIE